MKKFCGNCGKRRVNKSNFCTNCGANFNLNKKQLTKTLINHDLHNQKHSFGEYFGQVCLLGLMGLVVALGRPGILLCFIPWLINVIRMIRQDVRRSKLKYRVIQSQCLHKELYENDDTLEYRLWFDSVDVTKIAALAVEKDFYDATLEGEDFYVVYLLKDKSPSLCYRASEWFMH